MKLAATHHTTEDHDPSQLAPNQLAPHQLAPHHLAPTSLVPLSLVIASEVRFVRESLGQVLARDGSLSVVGYADAARQAVDLCRELRPRIALLDAAVREGASAVRQLRDDGADVKVVVFAVGENVETVLDWAEAGIAGYIPSDAGLDDLLGLLNDILNDRQTCSSAISAGLLRRLGKPATLPVARPQSSNQGAKLTPREREIVDLIAAGLSNKEIARRLDIGLATTKSHVHSVLNKLSLQRRGQAANWNRLQGSMIPSPSPERSQG